MQKSNEVLEAALLKIPARKSFSSSLSGRPALFYKCINNGISKEKRFNNQSMILVITNTITTTGTSNGLNAIDFLVVAGTPGTPKAAGEIWFATNTALGKLVQSTASYSAAAVDAVNLVCNGNTYQANIDPRYSFAAALNCFSTSGGLLGGVYSIFGGAVSLTARAVQFSIL